MSSTSSKRSGRRRLNATARTRLAVAVLLAGSAGLVGVAVSGQAATPPGLDFVQVGHWVYNDGLESAFHVDGSTNQVDAQVPVPGVERGSQVVQGDHSGYVVERSRITEFNKSTLSVENATAPPATEQPAVLEVAGGPYLVYRNAGQIVRLGDPPATVPAGGPLSTPVATGERSSDGATVWLHRIDSGALCELPKAATRLACPAQLPEGHTGSLTVVDDQPAVVDITAKTLRRISKDGFGEPTAIGVDLPATALVASGTVDGRLAVVDPERNRLHLIDTAGLQNRPTVKPVAVDLPKDGKFAGPVATARTIALVDQTRNELLTYDSNGVRKSTTKVPGEGGAPRLARGEDRKIYVDSPDGSHLLVVNSDSGTVADVTVAPAPGGATQAAAPPSSGNNTPAPPQEEPKKSEPPRQPVKPNPPPVAAATVPGAPGGVSAAAKDGSATVNWKPAAANGAAVTAYLVSWPGGSTTVGGSARSATVSGLKNGTSYVITVVAQNSAGRGPGASSGAVIPQRPAAAPSVSANRDAGGTVSVSWNQPDLGGGTLVHYQVSAQGQADRQLTATSTQFTGIAGAVTVRAVTRFGPSGSPNVTGAPGSANVPALPPTVKILKVVSSNTTFKVTVKADDKGSPATCQVSANGGTPSAPVRCSGNTVITFPHGGWAGAVPFHATITSAGGTDSDDIQVVPEIGGVVWLLPVTALAALRRKRRKGKVS